MSRKAYFNQDRYIEIVPHEAIVSYSQTNFKFFQDKMKEMHKMYDLSEHMEFYCGDGAGIDYLKEKNIRKDFMNRVYCVKLSSKKSNFLAFKFSFIFHEIWLN